MEHEMQAYFFDKVKQMRFAQKKYFKDRQSHWLRESKKLEKEVDDLIKNEEMDDKQQKLSL
jgi:hypothetical protein